ncbi:Crp/Fnr family transcriptional regulator [Paenibacillus psychroresistens]|uniref:Crp/Fnr family transcriptional regulator n=1 Tax=Paenibacillus psychroresistens TaxID=1778678 RepID=A0A6B8RUP1_9BACL|nr:Crp/Fnr family transcriptional regulator [Paenibacillus psychroresistens]QGQ98878.1 Crp/Fnr family transcriptional regulator [Paenibacillus psychroresistens]
MERDIKAVLRTLPFLQDLDAGYLESTIPLFQKRRVKKGSIIFFEGDEGDEFYIIESGLVKIYSFDGAKTVILAFIREGNYFGEMALIKPGLLRSATAETLEATDLYVLRRRDFEQLLVKNNKMALQMLWFTMERLRNANEQIQDLTFLNARERILKILLRLSKEHGTLLANGEMQINLKLTHQQIADLVGAVRETASKILQELQEEGFITVDQKKIILKDPANFEKKVTDV